MVAYWIAHVDVSDPEAYEAYRKANTLAFNKYNGRFIVRGENRKLLKELSAQEQLLSSSMIMRRLTLVLIARSIKRQWPINSAVQRPMWSLLKDIHQLNNQIGIKVYFNIRKQLSVF